MTWRRVVAAQVLAGEKWGLNIWLRERPRPARPRVRAALRPTDQRPATQLVTFALSVNAPRAATATNEGQEARCSGCGDRETPLGLCLCRTHYAVPAAANGGAQAPATAAPPVPERTYCDGSAIYERTTIFSRDAA